MRNDLGRLLDQAVPAIPAELRTAPVAAVRRRARRRRALLASAATGGAALTLVAAVAVALPLRSRPDVPPTGPSASAVDPSAGPATAPTTGPTIAADPSAVEWPLARVDRSERTITVYANAPAGECMELGNAKASVTSDAGKVVITVRGVGRRAEDCTRAPLAVPLRVTLPEPLGGRPLIDAATGRPASVFPERVLPQIPAGTWEEVPTEFSRVTGDRFMISYTSPGGPDLQFTLSRHSVPPPPDSVTERVVVGGHAALLFRWDTNWSLRWTADGIDVTLNFVPSEGKALTRAEVTGVIDRLGW